MGTSAALGLIRVSALSFWFFLAFPFGHHNESYVWEVLLEREGILSLLTTRLPPVTTFRPLGQATAWFFFRASGDGIVLGQIVNFVVAVVAWSLLGGAVKAPRVFALVAVAVQGAFFGGYIYLFHVHGVFYSPMLLLIAYLLGRADNPIDARLIARSAMVTVIASLYHPFSAFAYLAFLTGRLFEDRHAIGRRGWIAAALAAAVLLGLVLCVGQGPGKATPGMAILGLLASYRSTEPHVAASLVVAALCLLSCVDLVASRRAQAAVMTSVVCAVAACLALRLPLVPLWLALSAIRVASRRRYCLGLMLVALAMFPLPVGSGSATHLIPALFVGAAATALGQHRIEARLQNLRAGVAAAIVAPALALLCLALRSSAGVPVVSSLVHPLLAEKERTWQLEQLLEWALSSPYAGCRVQLAQAGRAPVEMSDVLDRRFRAPASQAVLDAYLEAVSHGPCPAQAVPVAVFGGAAVPGGVLLTQVPGVHAGAASLFLSGARAR